MRVAPCVILLIAVSLGLGGCQNSSKRPAGGGERAFMGGGSDETRKASEPSDPLLKSAGLNNKHGGLLAGQVIDTLSGRGVDADIQWVCLEEAKEGDKTFEVQARAQGGFIIQGLKPGKHYKLMARTTQGERKMAGIVYTAAPNPRIVIKLKDELVSSATPPSPPPPAPPGPRSAAPKAADAVQKKAALNTPERPASAVVPVWEPGAVAVPNPNEGKPPVSIRAPVPLGPPPSTQPAWGPTPSGPMDPSRIAREQGRWPPTAAINPALPQAPVPSCVLTGKHLINFALYDVHGRPWEYRTQRRGKLMLLDFWGTACIPCLNVLPHLSILHQQYGPSGLQVVGIACEGSGAPQDHARRVAATAESRGVNYPVLLGAGKGCPVQQQFGVTVLPTIVLVTDNGQIVWRHSGRLDRAELAELERRVKLWLGVN